MYNPYGEGFHLDKIVEEKKDDKPILVPKLIGYALIGAGIVGTVVVASEYLSPYFR